MSQNLIAGTIVGSYRIEALHATGAFGVVYRARHLDLDRQVALKTIRADLADQEEYRERFRREAQRAARLDHPGIVSPTDFGEWNGLLYIVMPFIDGPDLRAILKHEGFLKPKTAAQVVEQLAEALDHAHIHGLVHRDVKPANVLLLGSVDLDPPRVRLTDFGLARALSDTNMTSLTAPSHRPGTLGYMSPEQIHGHPIDHRSDVYSLGCVLVELITGKLPYPRPTPEAMALGHLLAEPPKPGTEGLGLPAAIDPVIRQALAKDPAERFQSAGELARATVQAFRTPPGHVDSATRVQATRPPKRPATYRGMRRGPSVRVLFALVAWVLLSAIASFGVAFLTWTDSGVGAVTFYEWGHHRSLIALGVVLAAAPGVALRAMNGSRLHIAGTVALLASVGAVAAMLASLIKVDAESAAHLSALFGVLGLGAGIGTGMLTSPLAARLGAALIGGVAGAAGGYLISLDVVTPHSLLALASLVAGVCALIGLGIGLVVATLSDRIG